MSKVCFTRWLTKFSDSAFYKTPGNFSIKFFVLNKKNFKNLHEIVNHGILFLNKFSLQKLHNLAACVPHRAVVPHHAVLHGLDQTTLDVAGLHTRKRDPHTTGRNQGHFRVRSSRTTATYAAARGEAKISTTRRHGISGKGQDEVDKGAAGTRTAHGQRGCIHTCAVFTAVSIKPSRPPIMWKKNSWGVRPFRYEFSTKPRLSGP